MTGIDILTLLYIQFRSLIDADSDAAILDAFQLHAHLRDVYPQKHPYWPCAFNDLFQELHRQGQRREDIEKVWSRIPLDPRMQAALTFAKTYSHGTDIVILSDANHQAIDTVLRHHKVKDLISMIVTNPAEWVDDHRLIIQPWMRVPRQHECTRIHPIHPHLSTCTDYLCKGYELAKLRHGYDRVVYVGDGLNDLCPVLGLCPQDYVLVRHGRNLHYLLEYLANNPNQEKPTETLEAKMIIWNDAGDVLNVFQSIFQS